MTATDPAETNRAVHDLLQRAELADKAAVIACEVGDSNNASRLLNKAHSLRADAAELDEGQNCPAWQEYRRTH